VRALKHGARLGAADTIYAKLVSLTSDIPVRLINPFRDLCHDTAEYLEGPERRNLIDKADELFGQSSHRVLRADVSFESAPGPAIDQLTTIRQQVALKTKIGDAPPEMIDGLIAETQIRLQSKPKDKQLHRILSTLYLKLAEGSKSGVLGLVKLSLSQFESQATKASLMLSELARTSPLVEPTDLWPLSDSVFPGVRRNHKEALINIVRRDPSFVDSDVEKVCDSLIAEANPVVVNRSYEFVMLWVRANKRMSHRAAESLAKSMRHLLKTGRINDGIIRSLIIIFKVLAQTENWQLAAKLCPWVEELITSVNIAKPDDGEPETIDLLTAMERNSDGFLASLVDKCPAMPSRNIRAIVCAIKNVQGPQSLLLRKILASDWCPPQTKSLILSFYRA
jgi:hypothetical protein